MLCWFLPYNERVKVTQSSLTVCKQILDQLSHQSAQDCHWIAHPFSSGSSQSRNWTGVSWIAGGFFASWATRKAITIIRFGHKYISPLSLKPSSCASTPPIQVITEHQTGLPVLLPTSWLFYTWYYMYVSVTFSIFPALSSPHKSVLYVCVSIASPQIGSSVLIF